MVQPDMSKVREFARKWKITAPVEPSGQKYKKLRVLIDGKWIHFGDSRYEDFTTHGNKQRQHEYRTRSSRIRDKQGNLTGNNPKSANYYAMRLLWDTAP